MRLISIEQVTYAGDVAHCVNTNSLKVFGRAFVPTFRPPAKYTGMYNWYLASLHFWFKVSVNLLS